MTEDMTLERYSLRYYHGTVLYDRRSKDLESFLEHLPTLPNGEFIITNRDGQILAVIKEKNVVWQDVEQEEIIL